MPITDPASSNRYEDLEDFYGAETFPYVVHHESEKETSEDVETPEHETSSSKFWERFSAMIEFRAGSKFWAIFILVSFW